MAKGTSQRFSSRFALIVSVLGIAVGTGNIWRFPRIAAQNGAEDGAGAFLIAWVVFLFIWSIPLIIAEYAMGRKGRLGVIGTFVRIAGKQFAWIGAFVAFVATAIMFYYSVVAGWCVYYFTAMVSGPLPMTTEAAMLTWEGFQASYWPVAFHALALGGGGLAVYKGVSSIERVNMVLIPSLFVIVLISVVRAVTLPGSLDGIIYLFTPQWSSLAEPRIWLEALTQNAWDTGAGWGLILTYGAYMQSKHGVVKNAFITGIGNNVVSLLAAIMIFGTVFAILGAEMSRGEVLAVMQQSGPAATGLTFIWMPQLFAQMQFGTPLAVLFFLGLAFAAFSSLISMIELAVRILVDLGLRRRMAIGIITSAGFLFGIPSAVNLEVFGNQDFVWGVALMISGALIAFAIIRYGVERFAREAINSGESDWAVGRTWILLIQWAIPLQALVLLVWWLSLSATVYAPDTWFDPFNPYSVMTCLVQWGVVFLVLYVLNNWLVSRTFSRSERDTLRA
jgi:neurotransmitter:Na+ symporter, NSS family